MATNDGFSIRERQSPNCATGPLQGPAVLCGQTRDSLETSSMVEFPTQLSEGESLHLHWAFEPVSQTFRELHYHLKWELRLSPLPCSLRGL